MESSPDEEASFGGRRDAELPRSSAATGPLGLKIAALADGSETLKPTELDSAGLAFHGPETHAGAVGSASGWHSRTVNEVPAPH